MTTPTSMDWYLQVNGSRIRARCTRCALHRTLTAAVKFIDVLHNRDSKCITPGAGRNANYMNMYGDFSGSISRARFQVGQNQSTIISVSLNPLSEMTRTIIMRKIDFFGRIWRIRPQKSCVGGPHPLRPWWLFKKVEFMFRLFTKSDFLFPLRGRFKSPRDVLKKATSQEIFPKTTTDYCLSVAFVNGLYCIIVMWVSMKYQRGPRCYSSQVGSISRQSIWPCKWLNHPCARTVGETRRSDASVKGLVVKPSHRFAYADEAASIYTSTTTPMMNYSTDYRSHLVTKLANDSASL